MNRGRALPSLLQALVLCVVIIASSGCATVHNLRDAQDAFSAAATIDHQLRSPDLEADEYAGLVAQRNAGYTAVVQAVDGVSLNDRRKLDSQLLWSNAVALKAIALWRLGSYDAAKATAKQIDPAQVGTRDGAVLAALPGLIKIDQAHAKAKSGQPSGDVIALLNAADLEIQSVRASVAAEEPVQAYLIEAQLAGDRNRVMARGQDGLETDEIAKAQTHWCDLERFLEVDDGELSNADKGTLAGWTSRLGLRADVDCAALRAP